MLMQSWGAKIIADGRAEVLDDAKITRIERPEHAISFVEKVFSEKSCKYFGKDYLLKSKMIREKQWQGLLADLRCSPNSPKTHSGNARVGGEVGEMRACISTGSPGEHGRLGGEAR